MTFGAGDILGLLLTSMLVVFTSIVSAMVLFVAFFRTETSVVEGSMVLSAIRREKLSKFYIAYSLTMFLLVLSIVGSAYTYNLRLDSPVAPGAQAKASDAEGQSGK